MAILNIVKDGDEILRKKSKPIEKIDEKLLTFIQDMKDTMEKAGGVGLAAVQVGKLRRVLVINTGEDELTLINPKMLKSSGSQEDLEGLILRLLREKLRRGINAGDVTEGRPGAGYAICSF